MHLCTKNLNLKKWSFDDSLLRSCEGCHLSTRKYSLVLFHFSLRSGWTVQVISLIEIHSSLVGLEFTTKIKTTTDKNTKFVVITGPLIHYSFIFGRNDACLLACICLTIWIDYIQNSWKNLISNPITFVVTYTRMPYHQSLFLWETIFLETLRINLSLNQNEAIFFKKK